MLEGCDIIHLKGGIHSFIWTTKKFFSIILGSWDISKSKWSIRFQNFWIWDNLVSWNLVSHIVLLIFLLPYVLQKWDWTLNMPLKWDMSQSSKIFIAREIMHKSRQYQISRYYIIDNFKFLKSDTPYCFAYISAPWYHSQRNQAKTAAARQV